MVGITYFWGVGSGTEKLYLFHIKVGRKDGMKTENRSVNGKVSKIETEWQLNKCSIYQIHILPLLQQNLTNDTAFLYL